MKDTYLILLFQIIRSDGNINTLIDFGLEYSQINKYIEWSIENGYVIFNQDLIELTDSGKCKLNDLNKKNNRLNSDIWISPLEQFKIEKIDKYDIYLPDKIK